MERAPQKRSGANQASDRRARAHLAYSAAAAPGLQLADIDRKIRVIVVTKACISR